MEMEWLKPPPGSVSHKKRVGRGRSSGHGKTSGRGHKGQKARGKVHPRFEGGQMPLVRRIPKRGFKPIKKEEWEIVNLKDLTIFSERDEITPEILKEKGLIKGKGKVKILGEGEIDRKLKVKAHAFSEKAAQKIKKAGGEIIVG